jgi:hypothetical protein
MKAGRVMVLLFFLALLPPSASAAQITASSDRTIYAIGDTLRVQGTVNSTSPTGIDVTFYHENGTGFDYLNATSVNKSFNFSYVLNVSAGRYYIVCNLTDGSAFVPLHFRVVPEVVRLEARLMNGTTIIQVNTTRTVTAGGQYGGNFTELLALSLSTTLHYGTADIDNKTYHFILVDQNLNGSYDTLYVDDDNLFQLYNDTEDNGTYPDVEVALKKGDPFKGYAIGEMDFNSGGAVLLARPRKTHTYSPGDKVDFMVLSKDANGNLVPNRFVNVTLQDKGRNIINSTTNTTNAFGYFLSSFTAPSAPGSYTISLNQSMGIGVFSVETFKLSARITDLNDNPASVFAPNPKLRITAVSKDPSGVLINLTSASAAIYYPNGTSVVVTLTQTSTGIYTKDLDFTAAPDGKYGVRITGKNGTDVQEVLLGFSIESVGFEVHAINTDFIGDSDSPEAKVNAFAPDKNITLLVVLSDIASGGLMAKGPEGMKTIPIDNASTPRDECRDLALLELVDDRGVPHRVNISSMNLTNFIGSMPGGPPPPDEMPPKSLLSQCMVVFKPPTNRTAVYRVTLQLDYQGQKKIAGETFGVQRLYAVGSTVDFNGEDFKFFTPNTTVRIKLKVTDLSNLKELDASKILDARITKVERHFPGYREIPVKNITGQDITNGTLSFTAPSDEGFFSVAFRFKANLSGSVESGVGNAFFMLKKYMVWGEPVCRVDSFGPCVFASTGNISLNINLVDIDQGARLDMGQTSGLSCTGCEGLVVGVERLMNEQLGKEITDFNVIKGTVVNGSATLNITSAAGLPPGWYGVDLVVTNPADPNESYFGFAWFEVRNFFVETVPVIAEDGNLTVKEERRTFQIGAPVTFGIIPRDPARGWEIITDEVRNVSIENLLQTHVWPPLGVSHTATISVENVSLPCGEGECPKVPMYVVNITGLRDEGSYRANVKVTTNLGSDIGDFDFSYASYYVNIYYRGMEDWPPVFGPEETLEVTALGWNFNSSPHNLGLDGTRLKMLYDIKRGRPIKVNTSYVNTTRPQPNEIRLGINLSGFSLAAGEYWGEVLVNDTEGVTKEEGIYFAVKDMVVAIPCIDDLWVGRKDSPERELNVDNHGDRCDNERWLQDWGTAWNGTFCIRTDGEWRETDGECYPGEVGPVNVTSNGTNLTINGVPYAKGDNFTITGDDKNWTVVDISSTGSRFRVRHRDGKICGSRWVGETEVGYVMTPPSNYSNFHHGYIRDLKKDEWLGQEWGQLFNQTREVYLYHNTTHLWMSNGTDLSSAPHATVGEVISDPYGGLWEVASISKHRVTLRGQNVLAETGAYIDTSLSKSGNIKLEQVEERRLGGWDERTHRDRGLDLNGDGLTNTTFFIALVDSTTAGIYDTFFFSVDGNFSRAISLSDSRENRTFGLNDTLTLFSIDPRASRVMAYSNRTSDWADLGDFKAGQRVTIPVMVSKPSGEPILVNVSIENVRKQIAFTPSEVVPLSSPVLDQPINGIGEISINLSASGLPSGEYAFEITARNGSTVEKLEEWKWPRATLRAFLTDVDRGFGGYVSGFKPLPLYRFDWESYGEIGRIRSDRRNLTNIIEGVLSEAEMLGPEGCVPPPTCAADWSNCTPMRSWDEGQYFLYNHDSHVLYRNNDSNCNFTREDLADNYTVGDSILIRQDKRTYNLTVLEIDTWHSTKCGGPCWRAAFGVPGVNSSVMEPLRNDSDWGMEWAYMQDVNISGTLFDVILAKDTNQTYPMCSAWGIEECAEKAWFVSSADRNFSHARGVRIGENFTEDLYLARIGPDPWGGIVIGNFTSIADLGLAMYPGAGIRVRDNTTSYFARIGEGAVDLDLNMDGSKNATYYALTFDNEEDGIRDVTEILTDDDLNITEPWWSISDFPMDFYGNETGMTEGWHGLPRGIHDGHTSFGDRVFWKKENGTTEAPWEYQPEWEIKMYNNTDMLLLKHRWEFNVSDNITLVPRVYDFEQTPIEGANITVTAIFGDVPGLGFAKLDESNYTVQDVRTDQHGYGVLRIAPANQWKEGKYMVSLLISDGPNKEYLYEWFGVSGGWSG